MNQIYAYIVFFILGLAFGAFIENSINEYHKKKELIRKIKNMIVDPFEDKFISNEQIKKASEVIRNFLTERGGCSNGYLTWVEGVICDVVNGSLEWHTPSFGGLTIDQYELCGRDLHNKIKACFNFNSSNFNVTIEKKHIEDGCFNTNIKIIYTIKVPL